MDFKLQLFKVYLEKKIAEQEQQSGIRADGLRRSVRRRVVVLVSINRCPTSNAKRGGLSPFPLFISFCIRGAKCVTRRKLFTISACISLQVVLKLSISGSKNATVFPVPVGESNTTSLCEVRTSSASFCIGFSVSMPNFSSILF